ncbi:MAG TPA: hypothetical protein ENL06_01615 [Candidatus Portnoybacteria bacterium]|nr:hypothetical protein [Candidatus Portnoybacteria bacterium]
MKKKIFQSILALCLVGIIILAGNYFLNQERSALPVQADTSDNISGFAWSEKIGWISFNNTSDGSAVNYGVNINPTTGSISGFAWSENIGWIDFDASDATHPSATVDTSKLGTANASVTGWARAVAHGGGWDGWIKFTNVYIDSSNDWHGWAWGSDVIGWISFNSSDPNAGGNYKVVYQSAATLSISCETTTLNANETTTCSANYDPDGGGPQSAIDVSSSASWWSSNSSIATIDSSGSVTAIGNGTVNIDASYHGTPAPPITITVNQRKTHWYEIIPW